MNCRGPRLPVLLYHHVGAPRPGAYPLLTVSPARFERQVRWLARLGYRGIRPSDWLLWIQEKRPLPRKPILLTFDDGYADLAEHAFPVLRRHGFSAAVYIVTGQIGKVNAWDEKNGWGMHRLLSAEQIREWAAQGIEFGSHARTHPDLTNLPEAELDGELAESGRELSGLLGRRPISFAYPYGEHNEAVRARVGRLYNLAFTVEEGMNTPDTDPFRLRRTMVLPNDTPVDFAGRALLGWSPLERLRAKVRLRTRVKASLASLRGLAP